MRQTGATLGTRLRIIFSGILLLLASLVTAGNPPSASAEPLCFPADATSYCIDAVFRDQWEQHGGLAINGYPLSATFIERLNVDGQPVEFTVQYFERVRMEWHPEANGGAGGVLLGQFGRQVLKATGGREIDPPAPAQSGGGYDPVTLHNIDPRFLGYWNTNGGLPQFGRPLTELVRQTLENGVAYDVQYFERARFEWHDEANQGAGGVLLGQFGRRVLTTALPVGPATPPTSGIPPTGSPLQHFQGTGPKVISGVQLSEGLALIRATSRGRSNFIAWLLDGQANEVALLANEIGVSDNGRAERVPSNGSFSIQVTADGSWTIDILQPGQGEFGTAVPLPYTFTGSKTQYTRFFVGREGGLLVNGAQSGKSNFIAWVLDAKGERVGLAANEIGSTPSSRLVRLPADGVYILTVQADGPWSISAGQP